MKRPAVGDELSSLRFLDLERVFRGVDRMGKARTIPCWRPCFFIFSCVLGEPNWMKMTHY